MIDDVRRHRPGPAIITSVETVQPVIPAFIRQNYNPILGFRVTVEGSEGKALLEGIELGFGGTTRMEDIESFKIIEGQADPSADPGAVIAEGNRISDKISLSLMHELSAGDHWFWVSPILKKTASIDGRIDASVFRVKVGGKVLTPVQPSPEGSQPINITEQVKDPAWRLFFNGPGAGIALKGGTLVFQPDS